MSVSLTDDGTIALHGVCPVENAEPLLQLLIAYPDADLDWRGCEHAHTAVVQIVLAAGRRTRGPPYMPFLAKWIEPGMRRT